MSIGFKFIDRRKRPFSKLWEKFTTAEENFCEGVREKFGISQQSNDLVETSPGASSQSLENVQSTEDENNQQRLGTINDDSQQDVGIALSGFLATIAAVCLTGLTRDPGSVSINNNEIIFGGLGLLCLMTAALMVQGYFILMKT
ncbi:MAG: hypothetical protein AAF289_14380 [Cyanobacteria bacterium P01_A01_bin.135]